MLLTRFDLFQYRLPLVAALKLKGALLLERKGLLVRLANPTGAVGWGEVSPLPGFSRESLEEARQPHQQPFAFEQQPASTFFSTACRSWRR